MPDQKAAQKITTAIVTFHAGHFRSSA